MRTAAPPGRSLPLLLALFAGSGCAALIYEIVWFQLLQLVIGSSAMSLAVLLGTFMGGMCLGSLVLPRWVSAHRHPLRVYAVLELGVALLGLGIWLAMPSLGQLYSAHVGAGFGGMVWRGVVSAICLLPPTLLMGMTLPAVARWVETTPQGVAWLGFFYAGNIAGAVLGCLGAGFYLLRVYDMGVATFVAVGLNTAVAMLALGLAARTTAPLPRPESGPAAVLPRRGLWTIYLAIALSGTCALGAEVVWTRLLSLILGGTVYTFSIILAVFLIGLGIGSGGGSLLARGSVPPRLALCACQWLQAGAVTWTATVIARSLPYWPIDPTLSKDPWIMFQVDLVRCLWAILPATLLWGASFPLAVAAAAAPGQDAGRLVGGVYAANTVGAILGGVGFSLGCIPWWGTYQSQRLILGLSVLAGLLALVSRRHPPRAPSPDTTAAGPSLGFAGTVGLGTALGLAALLVWKLPELPGKVVAYGRYLAAWGSQANLLYVGEGLNSSVAVSEKWESGERVFHVGGKVEASSGLQDMRLQRMLGHLPALIHPHPRSVLIVGCGAGVTAGSFVVHPEVERIVICELEPLVPRVVAEYFGFENYHLLNDRRVEVVYDDARHYILSTPEKFDLITSDPIHPWVKGAATLYTKEYYELVKRRLNPGGVVSQWVPLYESNPAAVKSELATFFAAFPGGTIWGNDAEGKGYDVVLLGQAEPTRINIDQMQARLDRTNHLAVTLSLDDVGFKSAVDLLSSYAGQASDLTAYLADATLNRDRNLRLQYLAGMGLNSDQSAGIYKDLLQYRRFPPELFVATSVRRQALRQALGLAVAEQ